MLLGIIRKHQETTGKNSNQKQTLTVHIIEKQVLSGSDHCQKTDIIRKPLLGNMRNHYQETLLRNKHYQGTFLGDIIRKQY